jgi:hypothetical protein
VLAPKEQQEGKRLELLPPAFQDNAYLWDSLRNEVYSGKSIAEIGERGITVGFWLTFITYLVVGVGSLFYLHRRYVSCGDVSGLAARFWVWGNLSDTRQDDRLPVRKRNDKGQLSTHGLKIVAQSRD